MSLTRGGGVNSGLLGVLLAAAACHVLTSCRASSQALTNILDVGSIYETNTVCQVVYTAGGMLLANHSMQEQRCTVTTRSSLQLCTQSTTHSLKAFNEGASSRRQLILQVQRCRCNKTSTER
jgi:hypothetical protein